MGKQLEKETKEQRAERISNWTKKITESTRAIALEAKIANVKKGIYTEEKPIQIESEQNQDIFKEDFEVHNQVRIDKQPKMIQSKIFQKKQDQIVQQETLGSKIDKHYDPVIRQLVKPKIMSLNQEIEFSLPKTLNTEQGIKQITVLDNINLMRSIENFDQSVMNDLIELYKKKRIFDLQNKN